MKCVPVYTSVLYQSQIYKQYFRRYLLWLDVGQMVCEATQTTVTLRVLVLEGFTAKEEQCS